MTTARTENRTSGRCPRPQIQTQSDQLPNRIELPMTVSIEHTICPNTSAGKRNSHNSSPAPRLATLDATGVPARSALPSCDDGWSLKSQHTGAGGRGEQFWTTARRVNTNSVELTVPTENVRYHINALLCAGMTVKLIAALAVLTPAAIRHLRKTSTTTTAPDIAAAVLAITFHPSRGRVSTPSIGARRRLRALNSMGYSDAFLARRLGVDLDVVSHMPEVGLIGTTLWESIDDLYDELAMQVGPDTEVRDRSRAAGLVPPLGWNDDEIDHPKAKRKDRAKGLVGSDPAAIIRRVRGERVALHTADVKEIMRIALIGNWSPRRVADVLGIEVESATREMSRHRTSKDPTAHQTAAAA